MRSPRDGFQVLYENGENALLQFLHRIRSEHQLSDKELQLVLFGISMRHPSWRPLAQEDLQGGLAQSDPELLLDFMGTDQYGAFCVRAIITLGVTGHRFEIVSRILSHVFRAHLNQNAPQS